MRRPLLFFFACLWSCAAAISACGQDPFRRDGIVAVVGETPITRTATVDLAKGELDRLREQASGEEFADKAQALLAAAAETLIRSELLLLEGKRLVDASEAPGRTFAERASPTRRSAGRWRKGSCGSW